MKKLLVIGLALSSIAFVKGSFNWNNDGFGKGMKGQGMHK